NPSAYKYFLQQAANEGLWSSFDGAVAATLGVFGLQGTHHGFPAPSDEQLSWPLPGDLEQEIVREIKTRLDQPEPRLAGHNDEQHHERIAEFTLDYLLGAGNGWYPAQGIWEGAAEAARTILRRPVLGWVGFCLQKLSHWNQRN